MRIFVIWLMLCGCVLGQVAFDGIDQYIMWQYNGPLSYTNASGMSLSMWLKLNSYDDFDNFASHQSGNGGEADFLFRIRTGGILQLFGTSAQANYTLATNTLSELTHVIITLDYSSPYILKCYINGNLQTEQTTSSLNFRTTQDYSIMAAVTELGGEIRFCNGTMTDYRHYYRVLSANEASEIYNRPWSLADDPDLGLRTCVLHTNNTGSALSGTAPNLNGPDGTYNNSPTAAPWTIQMTKPQRATYYPEYDTDLVRDMSGNGNVATNNGVVLSETASGWVGEFDYSSDSETYLYGGIDNNIGGDNFAIVGTFETYLTNVNQSIIVKAHRSSPYPTVAVRIVNGDKLLYSIANSGYGAYIQYQVETNVTYHFVVTTDGAGTESWMYIDGVLVSNQTHAAKNPDNADNWRIGRYHDGSPYGFGGRIESLYVYTNTLTADDASNLYYGAEISKSPIMHWTMQPEYK